MDCIFCKIINEEIPSYTIYEDDVVKCFLDVNPESNGHTLIIPKKHYTALKDIPINTLTHIMECAKKMEIYLEEKLHYDGLRLVQNNGFIQEVKHYHLHLIPIYKDTQTIKNVNEIFEIIK